MENRYR
jgi:chromosome segregation ATPase